MSPIRILSKARHGEGNVLSQAASWFLLHTLLCAGPCLRAGSALEITTDNLPPGAEQVHFTHDFTARGGLEPYRWSTPGRLFGFSENGGGAADVPEDLGPVADVAVDRSHAIALKPDGTVAVWGSDYMAADAFPPEGTRDVVAVAAGGNFLSLVLKRDGTVHAWGNNQNDAQHIPADLLDVVAISAGFDHAAALLANGRVRAWGGNWAGQVNVPSGLTDVVAISCGDRHTVALKADGRVVAWGSNSYNQSTVPAGLPKIVAVDAGTYHTLALTEEGSVVAWGYSRHYNPLPSDLTDVVAIEAGEDRNFAIRSTGELVVWGDQGDLQHTFPLAESTVTRIATQKESTLFLSSENTPFPGVKLLPSGRLEGVPTQAGEHHFDVIVRDVAGSVASTSMSVQIESNDNRPPTLNAFSPSEPEVPLERGESMNFSVDAENPEGTPFSLRWVLDGRVVAENAASFTFLAQPSDAGTYTLEVTASDDLWSEVVLREWTVRVDTPRIQLLTEELPPTMELQPYEVPLTMSGGWGGRTAYPVGWLAASKERTTIPENTIRDAVQILMGSVFRYVLRSDGSLEILEPGFYPEPDHIPPLSQVSVFGHDVLALQEDGHVFHWGPPYGAGQIPSGLRNVVKVAMGDRFGLALQADGTVVEWGEGMNLYADHVASIRHAVDISASHHRLVLNADGTVLAWGNNMYGQCDVPEGLSDVVSVHAGPLHSLAIRRDGSVVAWGWNSSGQCDVPDGLTNVVQVSAENNRSVALKADGTVVMWGSQTHDPIFSDALAWDDVLRLAEGGEVSMVIRGSRSVAGNVSLLGNGTLSGTMDDAGTYTVPVRILDARGHHAFHSYSLSVDPHPNLRPEISVVSPSAENPKVSPDSTTEFSVSAVDPESMPLTYRWTLNGEDLDVDGDHYTFTPGLQSFGTHALRVTVSDGLWDTQAYQEWMVSVTYPFPKVASTIEPNGMEAVPVSFQIPHQWGLPPTRWYSPGAVSYLGLDSGHLSTVANHANAIDVKSNGDQTLLVRTSDGNWHPYGIPVPDLPGDSPPVVDVAVFPTHGIAVLEDGTLHAWGNKQWDAGLGPPTPVEDMTEVVSIERGSSHYICLRSDGSVLSWGGAYNYNVADVPEGVEQVVQVQAGKEHVLVLKLDGSVIAWGGNTAGQCAIPENAPPFRTIAAGAYHNLAVTDEGTVVAWGSNSYGQCSVPEGLADVVDVAAGEFFSVALRADGTAVAWGRNTLGQCDIPASWTDIEGIAALDETTVLIRTGSLGIPGVTLGRSGIVQGLPEVAGTYRPPVVLVDSAGALSLQEVEWTVDSNPNKRPVLHDVSPQDPVVRAGLNESMTFAVSATDPEGEDVTFIWELNGEVVASGTNTYHLHADRLGELRLRVIAMDGLWDGLVYREWDVGVTMQPPGILTNSLPAGREMLPYDPTLTSGGHFGPHQWFVPGSLVTWGDDSDLALPDDARPVVALSAARWHALALHVDGTVSALGENNYGQSDVPDALSNVVAVSAGDYHSLVLRDDGTLRAWGEDFNGQTAIPAGLGAVCAIASGRDHNLALTTDGIVHAWGGNHHGEGVVPDGLRDVVAISAGHDHNLALCRNGSVVAWGDNAKGQSEVPTDLGEVVAISAGEEHSLALTADGHVRAWGSNQNGESQVPQDLENVVQIEAGSSFSLAVLADGTVIGWGRNGLGELNAPLDLDEVALLEAGQDFVVAIRAAQVLPGVALGRDGTMGGKPEQQGDHAVPIVVHSKYGLFDFTEFDVVIDANANLRPVISSGTPVSDTVTMDAGSDAGFSVQAHDPEGVDVRHQWTWNGVPVGTNTPEFRLNPEILDIGANTLRVSVSDDLWDDVVAREWTVTVGIPTVTLDGPPGGVWMEMVPFEDSVEVGGGVSPLRVYAVDSQALIGDNHAGQGVLPADVGDIVMYDSGFAHSIALKMDGTVAVWGGNTWGQLDLPEGLANVKAVAAGSTHSLALRADGGVVGWGRNHDGESSPPAGLGDVVAIAAGNGFSLALKRDGTVVAWGSRRYDCVPAPYGLKNVVAISAGGTHCLALKTDGTVVAWGNDYFGNTVVPEDLRNVVAISAGGMHSLALRADGTIEAWGDVPYYDLGMEPAEAVDIVEIAAGSQFNLALRRDGKVVAWGSTEFDQINLPKTNQRVATIFAGDKNTFLSYAPGEVVPGVTLTENGEFTGLAELAGEYSFPIFARDASGQHAAVQGDVTVTPNPNTRPVLTDHTPTDTRVEVPMDVGFTFTVDGYDPESEPLQYEWRLNGEIVGGNQPLFHYTPNRDDFGPHLLRVTVSDGLWEGPVFLEWNLLAAFPDLSIQTTGIPAGMEMVPLETSLAASGGFPPYSWSVPMIPDMDALQYSSLEPPPSDLAGVVQIAAGNDGSMAVLSDGSVVSWGGGRGTEYWAQSLRDVVQLRLGYSSRGALRSDGSFEGGSSAPAQLFNVSTFELGGDPRGGFGLALHLDGTLTGWGGSRYWYPPHNANPGQMIPPDLGPVLDIACGITYAAAYLENGQVRMWDGRGSDTLVDTQGKQLLKIVAGDEHFLGLADDGAVLAWGSPDEALQVPAAVENVVDISAGGNSSLALLEDGRLIAWGSTYPEEGEVLDISGTVTAIDSSRVVHLALHADGRIDQWEINQRRAPEDPGPVWDVAVNHDHAVALLENGGVVAWGGNRYGQCNVPEISDSVVQVSVDRYASMALTSEGEIVVWGQYASSELVPPVFASRVVSIALGQYRGVALLETGEMKAWGRNTYSASTVPESVKNIVAIDAEDYVTMALSADGRVIVWGNDSFGQTTVPVDLENVVAISAGSRHCMALKEDGTVIAWGEDISGETEVPTWLDEVVAIQAGFGRSAALRSDGTVVMWGYGNGEVQEYGSEGHGILGLRLNGSQRGVALEAAGLPDGVRMRPDGRLSGLPTRAESVTLPFRVRDIRGTVDTKLLNLVIEENPNRPPVIILTEPSGGETDLPENDTTTFRVTANDPEGQPLEWIWYLNGVEVSRGNGEFDFTTIWGEAGSYSLMVDVRDGLWRDVVQQTWDITVSGDNDRDGMGNLTELDLARDPNDSEDAQPPVSIQGVVTGAGVPLSGTTVELRGISDTTYHLTVTDSNGLYTFASVAPGTYFRKLSAAHFKDQWYPEAHAREEAGGYSVQSGVAYESENATLAAGQSPSKIMVTSGIPDVEVFMNGLGTGEHAPALFQLPYVSEPGGLPELDPFLFVRKAGLPLQAPVVLSPVEAETVQWEPTLYDGPGGELQIDTVPSGATVYVNNAQAAVGTTPLTVPHLAPGRHFVWLDAPGFHQPRPLMVDISEQETTEISLPLEEAMPVASAVEVTSFPSGAEVYFNYLATGGITPLGLPPLDFASHSGVNWQTHTHSVWVRQPGLNPRSPVLVPESGRMHFHFPMADKGDGDGNGLSDSWEEAADWKNRVPAHLQDAQLDADGDGSSNGEEIRAGTDPVDAASIFRIPEGKLQAMADGGLLLTCPTVPGKSYWLQGADRLDGTWRAIGGIRVAAGWETVFTVEAAQLGHLRFFRVISL